MNHYFTNSDVKSEIKRLDVKILDNNFTFLTDNGVFSKEKLDFGTRLLLENIDVENIYGDVLDVGCGYGPIGITVAKITDSNVTMCDVNKRALHLSDLNIKENKVNNIETLLSDCYSEIPANKKFDFIITNPPIHAGKDKVYEIVMNAKSYLKEKGTLYIVIRKDQGAKSMMKDLEKYYTVNILEKSKGFFIIKCNLLLTSC